MKKLELYEISEDEVESRIDGKPTHTPIRDPNNPCIVVRKVK